GKESRRRVPGQTHAALRCARGSACAICGRGRTLSPMTPRRPAGTRPAGSRQTGGRRTWLARRRAGEHSGAMIVGVPKEIKVAEQRIALTPAGARASSDEGHRVLVEAGGGAGSGFRDEEFVAAGAEITDVAGVWDKAELVLKVKEPLAEEVARIREGQA